jgi:hypothetical protein
MLPYLLVAAAAFITIRGFVKLGMMPRAPHRTPWGPLLVWAVLFAGTAVVWLLAAHHT